MKYWQGVVLLCVGIVGVMVVCLLIYGIWEIEKILSLW